MSNKYESANMQLFKAVRRAERARVFRRRFVKAIVPTLAGAGVVFALASPYINSSNTIDEFVNANDENITYVDDKPVVVSDRAADVSDFEENSSSKKVEDDIPWGTPPEGLSFEGDVVGYLSDEGDVLDNVYPITQSSLENANYYIDHDVNGDYSEFGNMYKDSRNHRGLCDDVTVIYGHNLIDGSMLGRVKDYADKDGYLWDTTGQNLYDEQNDLYGEKGNSLNYVDEYGSYQLDLVYAGVYEGTDVLSLVGNFQSKEDRELAIKLFKENSDIKSNISFDEDSKIVILQTCEDGDSSTYGDESKRVYAIYMVKQLVKYKDFEDTKESGKSLS